MEIDTKNPASIRFAYLDNVRSFVIFHVIAMHAAVTYSGDGGWYYKEGISGTLSIFETVVFGLFQSFLQAWFIGALFFISAFLVTKSLKKRGSTQFLKERFFRLGVPLLIYVFLIAPFIYFVLLGIGNEYTFVNNYIHYLTNFKWIIGSTGPLWFVEALLLFCIIYVIIRKFFPNPKTIHAFNTKSIVFAIIITGIFAFLIRLIFPLGTSFYNLQFGYFGSYIALFIIGIIVGENNLFENISGERNIKWIKITLIAGPIIWFAIMLLGGATKGHRYFDGGLHWQSLAFALWEAFFAIGFSIGIIAFFKKRLNINNKYTQLIADNSFGIYFFHAPLLIAVSLLLKHWTINPLLKFMAVTIIAFVVTLIFSYLVRKIKFVKTLLK
ncbi:MAG: acyltransferase family protein [Dysgonamonadaceae bacterium]|jgi:peptidoglycan/LPS O-acetylase OafA/YrhL|nr:acyltransferase family protein [Dysgonamonadaceae bacterium]